MDPETRLRVSELMKARWADPKAWPPNAAANHKYQMAVWAFQILYEQFGPAATTMAEEYILWPDERRMQQVDFSRYAEMVDTGKTTIPDPVRQAIERRYQNIIKSRVTLAVLAAAKAHTNLSMLSAETTKLVKDGQNPEPSTVKYITDNAAFYSHAGQGVGWMHREAVADKQQQVTMNGPRFQLVVPQQLPKGGNGTKSTRLRKFQKQLPAAVEAEYRELE